MNRNLVIFLAALLILFSTDLFAEAPSFRRDVMPVFFRAGCNSGTCHGSARGKDGFMLSLFGYDARGDYFRLTQELIGRRVNVAAPSEGLLLKKVSGQVPHTGGKRFDVESPYYQTLLKWIEAGAPDDPANVPEPVEIKLEPDRLLFDVGAAAKPTVVTARYSDRTTRDVSKLALFVSNNPDTATISADGVVTSGKQGDTFVFTRFNRFTIGSEVIVRRPSRRRTGRSKIAGSREVSGRHHRRTFRSHADPQTHLGRTDRDARVGRRKREGSQGLRGHLRQPATINRVWI